MKRKINKIWQWVKRHCCLLKIVMYTPSPLQEEVTRSLMDTIKQSEESIEQAENYFKQLEMWIAHQDKKMQLRSAFRQEDKMNEIKQWSLHLQNWRNSVARCKANVN